MPWMMDDPGASNYAYLKITNESIAMFEKFLTTAYSGQAEGCLEVAKRIKLNLESVPNR